MSEFKITGPGEYRTRGGEKVIVTGYDHDTITPYVWDGKNGRSWTEYGVDQIADGLTERDIIDPWEDEPKKPCHCKTAGPGGVIGVHPFEPSEAPRCIDCGEEIKRDTDYPTVDEIAERAVANNSVTFGGADSVNHPAHYTTGKIEVIDFIEDQKLPYHLGNVVKYIARAPHKGTELQDLKKARWYLDRYIAGLEG